MKKLIHLLSLIAASLIGLVYHAKAEDSMKTAYDFEFMSLSGEALPLGAYRGRVVLIVNTASKCGFTPQYTGLQALYERYKDRGLVIIGVPSNDFGGQEPGTEAEIASFCQINYGVTFPMTAKYVVTGAEAHPFYQWARESLGALAAPKWNFHKYLIGRDGKLADYFASTTAPDSEKLRQAAETALSAN